MGKFWNLNSRNLTFKRLDATSGHSKAAKRKIYLNKIEILICCHKGPFTNYVYKRRGVGGQKNRLFVNFYTVENVNGGG